MDAPCTTDRQALWEEEDSIFRRSRSAERLSLPETQTRLLHNALRAVKVGGSVVYATCSLSPLQNEAVVERAVGKAAGEGIRAAAKDLSPLREALARTSLFRFSPSVPLGILVLPFLPSNFGPMYVCKLQRLE